MRYRKLLVLGLATVLGCGAILAQEVVDDEAVPEPAVHEDVPCLIDAELSLWLALEAVDRTIVRLERERRSLTAELMRTRQQLDLLALADSRDGVPFVQLTELAQAKAVGREVFDNAHAELQSDLIELDKTLVRRRRQQALLEAKLAIQPEPAGG